MSAQRKLPAPSPSNGDVRPCPKCGGRSEFNARYRSDGRMCAAWVCDSASCKHWDMVSLPARARAARDASRELIRQSKNVQAKSKRAIMRTRARIDRADTRLARSSARLGKRKP